MYLYGDPADTGGVGHLPANAGGASDPQPDQPDPEHTTPPDPVAGDSNGNGDGDGDGNPGGDQPAPQPQDGITITGQTIEGTEGGYLPSGQLLATFADTQSDIGPGGYNVSVTYDGQDVPVYVLQGADDQTFNVYSDDSAVTLGEEGWQPLTIDVTQADRAATGTGWLQIDDAPLDVRGPAASIPVTSGKSWTGVIATFTDANPTASVDDFQATIDYGPDGADVVPADRIERNADGSFSVYATHTFTGDHQPHVPIVTVVDLGGSTDHANSSFYSISQDLQFGAGMRWDGLPQEESINPGGSVLETNQIALLLQASVTPIVNGSSSGGPETPDLPDGTRMTLSILRNREHVRVWGPDPLTGRQTALLGSGIGASSVTWTLDATDPLALPPQRLVVEGVDSTSLDDGPVQFLLTLDTAKNPAGSTNPPPASDDTQPTTKPATQAANLGVDARISSLKWVTWSPTLDPQWIQQQGGQQAPAVKNWTPNKPVAPKDPTIAHADQKLVAAGDVRIFPEKITPDDNVTAERRSVILEARLARPKPNVVVNFGVWDNYNDNVIAGQEKRGEGNQAPGNAIKYVTVATDAQGVARITWTVVPQPGNDYEAFASSTKAVYEVVQYTQKDHDNDPNLVAGTLNATGLEKKGLARSPMLTVWRTLHVEQDSMAAPELAGGKFPDGSDPPALQLDPDRTRRLADVDTALMNPWYNSAYVNVEGLKKYNKKTSIPWNPVIDVSDVSQPWATAAVAARDVPSQPDFWVTQIVDAYKSNEAKTAGITSNARDGACFVFYKNMSDIWDAEPANSCAEKSVVLSRLGVHESLHRWGLLHKQPDHLGDGGIMASDASVYAKSDTQIRAQAGQALYVSRRLHPGELSSSDAVTVDGFGG